MKPKIISAVLDMMSKVKYVESGNSHYYERIDTGKRLAGVTSVTNLLPKDWMPAWGAKEAVKFLGYFDKFKDEISNVEQQHLKEQLKSIKKMSPDEFFKHLHNAKSAFRRKSDKAKDIGQEGHDKLEEWVKAKIRNKPLPDLPDMCKPFIEWSDKNIKEFYLSEARVCDLVNDYAGTLDLLALMTSGNIAIIDFKFADNISDGWRPQTAAYLKTFIPYGIDVKERYALRFPKSEYLKRWDKKSFSYTKIKNEFQSIEYNNYLDFDFETFLSLRQAFKWINFKGK